MKNINEKITLIGTALTSQTAKLAILIATIALFVLSAAAPNATIGIGK